MKPFTAQALSGNFDAPEDMLPSKPMWMFPFRMNCRANLILPDAVVCSARFSIIVCFSYHNSTFWTLVCVFSLSSFDMLRYCICFLLVMYAKIEVAYLIVVLCFSLFLSDRLVCCCLWLNACELRREYSAILLVVCTSMKVILNKYKWRKTTNKLPDLLSSKRTMTLSPSGFCENQ